MEILLKRYSKPEIKEIIIDQAISLQLESVPPGGPEEVELIRINTGYRNNPYDSLVV